MLECNIKKWLRILLLFNFESGFPLGPMVQRSKRFYFVRMDGLKNLKIKRK